MIKKFLIYLIINWIALSSISAQTYFSKNYPITNHWGGGSFNSIENDLGYLMLGGAISFTTGKQELVVIQTDFEGNVLFEKNYGDTSYSYYMGFQGSLQKLRDREGYIMYGSKQDNNSISYDVLYRFNDDGDTLWTKSLAISSNLIGRNVKETLDRGFICLGDGFNGGSLVYLIKTDSLGNEEWSKYIGPTQDVAYNIAVCGDGGYIFTGKTENSGNDQIRVTKVDSLGNKLFNNFFGGVEDYDGGRCVIESLDGGYIVSGGYNTPVRMYPFVLKLDQNGDSLWLNKIVPLSVAGGYNYLRTVLELEDGSLVTTGSNYYFDGGSISREHGLIVKLNPLGNIIWHREYNIAETNSESSYLYDIRTTTDGGFVCSGYSSQPQEMWLLKLDSLGCADTTCALATTITAPQSSKGAFKVFPNPNQGTFTIEHELPEQNRVTLNVYNLTGKKVYEQIIVSQKENINLSYLPKGVYLIKIIDNHQVLYSKKIALIE